MQDRENRIYIGAKFGRLTVLEKTDKRNGYNVIYRCKCDCGNYCEIHSGNLGRSTNSCGCLEKENRLSFVTHNLSHTKLYDVWTNMKQRCLNPNNPSYENYGRRGISICDEWIDNFENFYKWAINSGYVYDDVNGKNLSYTLDRIDVNGNYEPSNCRWISNKKQQNNKQDTCYYEYEGETHTISEWADILNLPLNTLKGRLSKHWDIKRVLEEPIVSKPPEHLIEYNNQIHNIKQWSEIIDIPYKTLKGRIYNGWDIEKAFNTPIRKSSR